MDFFPSVTILISTSTILLNASVHGLGVNCRGSFRYRGSKRLHAIDMIIQNLASMNDQDTYARGVHIACVPSSFGGSFCAFTQGYMPNPGVTGALLKQKIQELRDHSCEGCGSVPFSGNDPDPMGFLTVNYVDNTEDCDKSSVWMLTVAK